ncbi:MAG: TM2 domain-containing protein [Coriobacteriia bacterium]|nr:TM2 domain-containing protein [Coriobacteriia bacterium]MCL2749452.1 TM2 domain-containing protein [Coriobacteriia bacterium]
MNENQAPQTPEQSPVVPTPPAQAGQAPTQPPPTYQVPPQQQYYAQPQANTKTRTPGIGSAQKEKWPAVILAFVLGWLGMHKFYLGYKSEGLVMLLVSAIGLICTVGVATSVMVVIAIVEAVKYITSTEEDFEQTYVKGYKGWF